MCYLQGQGAHCGGSSSIGEAVSQPCVLDSLFLAISNKCFCVILTASKADFVSH